jgi:hypothetical protein
MSSNQRPDTLMQDRIIQIDEIFLHRTAGPYILGHSRHFEAIRHMSALAPIATEEQTSANGRFVPEGDILVFPET